MCPFHEYLSFYKTKNVLPKEWWCSCGVLVLGVVCVGPKRHTPQIISNLTIVDLGIPRRYCGFSCRSPQ